MDDQTTIIVVVGGALAAVAFIGVQVKKVHMSKRQQSLGDTVTREEQPPRAFD